MKRKGEPALSRREREIMDIVYARGRASANEIREAMTAAPSYSAVRALLRVLEEKGHLGHTKEGVRNVYLPTRPRAAAGRSAMRRALQTFFAGDVGRAVTALLDVADTELSSEERERLVRQIEQAEKEER